MPINEAAISQLINGVFIILSVVIGAVITFIINRNINKRSFEHQLWEKIIDKKIDAHEKIMVMAYVIRTNTIYKIVGHENEIFSGPSFFESKEKFDEFWYGFTNTYRASRVWLNPEVSQLVFNFVSYIANVGEFITKINEIDYPLVGIFLRKDFINLSIKIEEFAYSYFQKDFLKLHVPNMKNINTMVEEKDKSIKNSIFYKQRTELISFINQNTSKILR